MSRLNGARAGVYRAPPTLRSQCSSDITIFISILVLLVREYILAQTDDALDFLCR